MFDIKSILTSCTVIAFGLFMLAPANAASKRVALVIGNSTYEHSSVLSHPENDAMAIAKALKDVGFDVIMAIDVTYREMPKLLSRFAQKLRTAKVGLCYYSGHSLQIEGENYLVPVDADVPSKIDAPFQAVRLDRILNILQQGPEQTLVFLDASGDNPLAKKLARSFKTGSSIIGRGLARIKAQSGMMVAYATAPGDVVQARRGKYSPFTKAVVAHIATPGLGISQMLRQVRKDVMKATGHEQVPWMSSSLRDDFMFQPRQQETVSISLRAGPQPAGSNAALFEQNAWNATVRAGSCGAYRQYMNSYAQSFFTGLAQSWIDKNCANATPKPASPQHSDMIAMLPLVSIAPNPRPSPAKSLPYMQRLARTMQAELQRIGCLSSKVDGLWGQTSRRAVDEYNRVASRKISPELPSIEAINVLKRVGPATCQLQPEIASALPGKWACKFKTDVYLTRDVFLMKQGKKVIGEICRADTVISEFDGKYYWLKQSQNCRAKSMLAFGVPVSKTSYVKSRLWFKRDKLFGQAYETSKKIFPWAGIRWLALS